MPPETSEAPQRGSQPTRGPFRTSTGKPGESFGNTTGLAESHIVCGDLWPAKPKTVPACLLGARNHTLRPLSCDTHGPFPFAAVRDLLGITRALYRAEIAGAADGARLRSLEEIGRGYRSALDLARRSGEGTLGRRAAWSWAEKSTSALGNLVAEQSQVATLVRASAALLGRRP
jgi:hypothetical protein